VASVVYPSVGIFLNHSFENHIGSNCELSLIQEMNGVNEGNKL